MKAETKRNIIMYASIVFFGWMAWINFNPLLMTFSDVFIGEQEEEMPDPGETFQAPFAYDPSRSVDVSEGLPENNLGLDKPHRTDAEIINWLMIKIPESLSLSPDETIEQQNVRRAYFSTKGWQQLNSFLQKEGLNRYLDSKKYYIRGFMDSVPILINEGPLSGQYRWLFEAPVMISAIDKDLRDYQDEEANQKHFVIKIQVGRTSNEDADNGIIIERWTLR